MSRNNSTLTRDLIVQLENYQQPQMVITSRSSSPASSVTTSTVSTRSVSSSRRRLTKNRRNNSERGLSHAELVRSCGENCLWPSSNIRQSQCCCCKLRFQTNDICRETVCGHSFHAVCLEAWFARHTRCPVAGCRRKFKHCMHTPENIRARMSPVDDVSVKVEGARPRWSPSYDAELLQLSDEFDKMHRQRVMNEHGKCIPPRSSIFLGADMPVVKEDEDDMPWYERLTPPPMNSWDPEMRTLAVVFACSMWALNWQQFTALKNARDSIQESSSMYSSSTTCC